MRLTGIPIIQPIPLKDDPCGPMGSPQPIIQLKELEVDRVRHGQWQESLKKAASRKIEKEGNKT